MNRGFSTLELLIALMILSSTLAAVALLALGLPDALANGQLQEEAMNHANQLLQGEFAAGQESFAEVTSLATTSASGYSTGLVVTLLPDGITKQLVSTTQWIDIYGHIQYTSLSGIVTDFKDISTNGSCDPVLEGDWTHPVFTPFPVTPGAFLPSSFIGSYPIKALALGTSTLIAGVSSSTYPTNPTILLFSLASSTHPSYLGSLDNNPTSLSGVSALAIHGSTIYAANAFPADFSTCSAQTANTTTGMNSSCSQLQIINASNPAAPILEANFQLATSTAPFVTGSSGQGIGKSLFYSNGLLYMGLQKTASLASGGTGDEFNIINVQNPLAPVWLGGYSVGRTINQIQILNGYAYLATDDPERELIVLDVHDPTHPTLVGSYNAPGSSIYGYGEAVAVSSTTAVLGRSYTYNGPDITVLNTAGLSATNASSALSLLASTTERTSVSGVIVQSFLAFVLTTAKLEFWNLASASSGVLTPYTASGTLPSGETPSTDSLVCRHSTIYFASTDASQTGYITVVTGS